MQQCSWSQFLKNGKTVNGVDTLYSLNAWRMTTFYGFEISAEYCDIAEKRIASVGKDIPLFEAD